MLRLRAAGLDLGTLTYDEVDRRALDAVVILPHFELASEVASELPRQGSALTQGSGTEHWVVLRSAVRPPVTLRDPQRSPLPESGGRGLWEAPAGLVEPDESSPEGLRRAALRELLEETGFSPGDAALFELGPPAYPCPGVIAERHFFFRVRIDPDRQVAPPLDGSALEAAGEVIAVPLHVALAAARQGELADAKTELAVRRLSEELGP